MLKKLGSLLLSFIVVSAVFAQSDDWYKGKNIRKIKFNGLKKQSQPTMAEKFDK